MLYKRCTLYLFVVFFLSFFMPTTIYAVTVSEQMTTNEVGQTYQEIEKIKQAEIEKIEQYQEEKQALQERIDSATGTLETIIQNPLSTPTAMMDYMSEQLGSESLIDTFGNAIQTGITAQLAIDDLPSTVISIVSDQIQDAEEFEGKQALLDALTGAQASMDIQSTDSALKAVAELISVTADTINVGFPASENKVNILSGLGASQIALGMAITTVEILTNPQNAALKTAKSVLTSKEFAKLLGSFVVTGKFDWSTLGGTGWEKYHNIVANLPGVSTMQSGAIILGYAHSANLAINMNNDLNFIKARLKILTDALIKKTAKDRAGKIYTYMDETVSSTYNNSPLGHPVTKKIDSKRVKVLDTTQGGAMTLIIDFDENLVEGSIAIMACYENSSGKTTGVGYLARFTGTLDGQNITGKIVEALAKGKVFVPSSSTFTAVLSPDSTVVTGTIETTEAGDHFSVKFSANKKSEMKAPPRLQTKK